jgi:Ca2+-binding EF-hand superfamily protein
MDERAGGQTCRKDHRFKSHFTLQARSPWKTKFSTFDRNQSSCLEHGVLMPVPFTASKKVHIWVSNGQKREAGQI